MPSKSKKSAAATEEQVTDTEAAQTESNSDDKSKKKRTRHAKPGSKAASQVKKAQNDTKLCIRKSPFKRILVSHAWKDNQNYRLSKGAVELAQHAVEALMVRYFEQAESTKNWVTDFTREGLKGCDLISALNGSSDLRPVFDEIIEAEDRSLRDKKMAKIRERAKFSALSKEQKAEVLKEKKKQAAEKRATLQREKEKRKEEREAAKAAKAAKTASTKPTDSMAVDTPSHKKSHKSKVTNTQIVV